MIAWQLDAAGLPMHKVERPMQRPGTDEVRVRVLACGVCRTDQHIFEGDISGRLPIILGHEIVGEIEELGAGVTDLAIGQRVGVPWLGHSCRQCHYCRTDRENLCDAPEFTGFTRDGGYASHTIADARYCFPLPEGLDPVHAAPLLCAGLIGFRSYRMAGGMDPDVRRIGFYGFGAAAHIIAQVAVARGQEIYAFTRPGDRAAEDFARSLGCAWAGPSSSESPEELDSAIIFAAVGALVPAALKAVRKGGEVICAGIHMSEIPAFPYSELWEERSIQSVANLTRADGLDFMRLLSEIPVETHVTPLPLDQANEAMRRMQAGEVQGALVLVP